MPANKHIAFSALIIALLAVSFPSIGIAQTIEVIPPPPKPAGADSHQNMQSLEESLEVAPPVNIVHTSVLQILCDPDKFAEQSVNFRAYSEIKDGVMRLYPTDEIAAANLELDSIKSLPLVQEKISLMGLSSLAECNNTRVRVTGTLIHKKDMQPDDVQINVTQLSYF